MRDQKNWTAVDRLVGGLTFLAPVSFMASIPWLKDQPDDIVYMATLIAVVIVISGSVFLSYRGQKKSDEVQLAENRFSYAWGGLLGGALIAILLSIPAFQTLLVETASMFDDQENVLMDRTAVLLIFTMGMGSVILAQSLFTLIFSAIWRARMYSAV